jgi:hypothetical protein
MGRKGTAVTFFSNHDLKTLKEVIRTNNIKPVWLTAAPQLGKTKKPRKTHRK